MVKYFKFAIVAVLLLAAAGCSNENKFKETDFVGKWQSSRLTTPVYLHADGEWEFRTESGEIQQYGIWMYYNNTILWTVRVDERIQHDPNPVLSVSENEFQLRERDGSVTTFRRL